MVRYETLVLTVPEITGDEAKHIEKELAQLVEKNKGSFASFDRWGKYRLSYPVKKNEYGVYFLARFETEDVSDLPKEIAHLCKVKLNSVVMRDMTSRLAEGSSLDYQRPPSLEDAPTTRDVRTFLRENKMEGLLSTVDGDKKKSKPATEAVEVAEKVDIQESAAPNESDASDKEQA